MRTITTTECIYVSGGIQPAVVISGIVALVGGTVTYEVVSYFPGLTTAIGTVGCAVGAGAICTPFAPVVGTVLCGSAGGLFGYVTSSTLANIGAFFVGAAGTGLLAYAGLR